MGLTYEALSDVTGERERVVHFTLPPRAAAVLGARPGVEGYDEWTECLRCLKPGAGPQDAPRASSLPVSMCWSLVDPELPMKHVSGKLVLVLTKHVDDAKAGGEPFY